MMANVHTRMFRFAPFVLILFVLLFAASESPAQIKNDQAGDSELLGPATVSRYRVGVVVTASRGPVQKILGTVALPLECPEQKVTLLEEDVSPEVANLSNRQLPGQEARQMLVEIPYLQGGQEARAVLTFEVETRAVLPPEDTLQYTIPDKPDRELKRYLGRSPFIETNSSQIRRTSRKIFAELEKQTKDSDEGSEITDWQRVEAIYDFVQEKVKYVEGPDKSAVQTLSDGFGDCQNISALFVALCRTNNIPARIVWVHQHNYMEFCLVDAEGSPHWFPCESSGNRAFGEMPLARVIMQKGDSFRVPERKETLRYASDYLIGLPVRGSGKPKVRYIREPL